MSRTTPLTKRSTEGGGPPLVDTSTLCGAVATGNIQLVEQLIKSGADVNQRSSDGFVPLCIAAFWGYAEIVKLLLDSNVNVNATNRGTGWTACHCASFQGHGKVLMYLMQYQPDLNIEDSMGRTAVDFASTQDSIWPFFSILKCQRSSKERLIQLNIIQKLPTNEQTSDEPSTTKPLNRLTRFSRPGSSYTLADPMITVNNETTTSAKVSAAREYGDILHEED